MIVVAIVVSVVGCCLCVVPVTTVRIRSIPRIGRLLFIRTRILVGIDVVRIMIVVVRFIVLISSIIILRDGPDRPLGIVRRCRRRRRRCRSRGQ